MSSQRITAIVMLFCLLFADIAKNPVVVTPVAKAETETETETDEMSLSDRVTMVSAVVSGYREVRIAWESEDSYFDGFEIYRSEKEDSGYVLMDTVYESLEWDSDRDIYAQTWIDDTVSLGNTYYYRVRGFESDGLEMSETYFDGFTLPVAVTVTFAPVDVQKVVSVNESTLQLEWKEVPGATSYEIYRSLKKTSGFEKVATVDAGVTKWEDQGLRLGVTYYYKLRAVHTGESETAYGEWSVIVFGMPVYAAPDIKKIKLTKPYQVKVTWTKNNVAKGYELYRSKGSKKKFKKIKTFQSNTKTNYTVKKLKNGIKYYYQVCAIGTVSGKKIQGTMSPVKGRVMDYYGYDAEPYEHRTKRIFGKKGYSIYKSRAKAASNMKTLRIKVWDIRSGRKVTRRMSLTVHKKIAPTVRKIFQEIYKGREKFPIHDIGGYSWRGAKSTSEHMVGLAIDINSNENYMIQGKKVLAGSFWRPGKNPYSIPTDGEVANIMRKYGFYQGIWGSRRDYMHFSYFGG